MIANRNGRMVEQSAEVRNFGNVSEIVPLPDLVEIQTKAYEAFLAPGIASGARDAMGLEALLREIFPIYSHEGRCPREGRPRVGRPRRISTSAASCG